MIGKKWLGSWVEEAAEEATETKKGGAQQRTRKQRKVHGQRGTWA